LDSIDIDSPNTEQPSHELDAKTARLERRTRTLERKHNPSQPISNDTIGIKPVADLEIGDFVAAKDPATAAGWYLGRVIEICSDAEGKIALRMYGDHKKTSDLSKQRFKPAWFHQKGNKLSFQLVHSVNNAVPEELEIEPSAILVSGVCMVKKDKQRHWTMDEVSVAHLQKALHSQRSSFLILTTLSEFCTRTISQRRLRYR
jgi:hypothetical protein